MHPVCPWPGLAVWPVTVPLSPAAAPLRAVRAGELVAAVLAWARRRPDVHAVGLAGSWAHGTADDASDVDLVVLCDDPQLYVHTRSWTADALGVDAPLVRTCRWGVLVERRVAPPGAPEVEFGLVTPDWARTDPVDPGTARVVGDGLVPVHDPHGLLAQVVAAVGARSGVGAGERYVAGP